LNILFFSKVDAASVAHSAGDSSLNQSYGSDENGRLVIDEDVAEDEENFSLVVSDGESMDNWMVEDELKECAQDLEKMLEKEKDEKMDQDEVSTIVQEQGNQSKGGEEEAEVVEANAFDLMRAMLDVQVASPISAFEPSVIDDGQPMQEK
jgi:hypothetical protein